MAPIVLVRPTVDTADVVVARRASWRDRLMARLRRTRLDGQLARGVAPSASAPLALRAEALGHGGFRTMLGERIRHVLEQARGPRRISRVTVPLHREAVLEAAQELEELAGRLLSPGLLAARGSPRFACSWSMDPAPSTTATPVMSCASPSYGRSRTSIRRSGGKPPDPVGPPTPQLTTGREAGEHGAGTFTSAQIDGIKRSSHQSQVPIRNICALAPGRSLQACRSSPAARLGPASLGRRKWATASRTDSLAVVATREQMSIDLDAEVAAILRAHAAEARLSEGEIVDRAIRAYDLRSRTRAISERSDLDEDEAMALVREELRAARAERHKAA